MAAKNMKKNPALTGLVISIFVTVLAFGIYFLFLAKEDYYLVDNPSAEAFFFKINNGEEQIITSGQNVKVKLNQGKNSILVFDSKKKPLYDSAFTVYKTRGLVNIARQDYYINTQYYGYDLKKDSLLMALGTTAIDGKLYHGAPKLFNGIYTDDFYYNVDEAYDGVVKNVQKVENRSKIFRKHDFLSYYKQYYQY